MKAESTKMPQFAPLLAMLRCGRNGSSTPEWQRVLKQFGLEGIGVHAKRFFPRRGPEYEGWKEADTVECFNSLIAVINAAEVRAVGASLVVDIFNQLNADERRYVTGAQFGIKANKWLTSGAPKTPYHVPVQHAVIDGGKMASPENKAHFVHDQQNQYAPLVLERFAELKKALKIKDNLGDMVFSSRLEAIPLQAADLIAYVATKHAEARLASGLPNVPLSYESRRILERPHDLRFIDRHGISLILDGCPAHLRTSFLGPGGV
jgi:hypothetical protein